MPLQSLMQGLGLKSVAQNGLLSVTPSGLLLQADHLPQGRNLNSALIKLQIFICLPQIPHLTSQYFVLCTKYFALNLLRILIKINNETAPQTEKPINNGTEVAVIKLPI